MVMEYNEANSDRRVAIFEPRFRVAAAYRYVATARGSL